MPHALVNPVKSCGTPPTMLAASRAPGADAVLKAASRVTRLLGFAPDAASAGWTQQPNTVVVPTTFHAGAGAPARKSSAVGTPALMHGLPYSTASASLLLGVRGALKRVIACAAAVFIVCVAAS